ncbi:hypothetical protein QYE76_061359 [Lolium multiflorum]|uniref:Retrotransposon gag domain-containing protein n=1 Tax=Lolium multiflorum TaxID=4521 RepID=A0AAD8S1G3_LOLMU|nr:hypothetical protein QYE76_061359 [Lolium multiflorum]
MADGTPVTYEDLTDELKKKYDEVRTILEADLIGSFRTRSHGIVERVLAEGALDGIDLSAHRRAPGNHESSVLSIRTSSGHTREMPLQSRPPLPFALAAPEVTNSPAFVVYKIGGDPSDCQFLHEAPKEIPHGYMCTYVPDCGNWALTNQAATAGTSGKAGGTSATDLEKQTWLAKYATPTNLQSSAPAVGSELEKQAWLAKYATPANLQSSTPAASTADQISTILRDQFGMVPKRRTIGYSKPYPNEYELVPLPPKYRLPDFSKFSGSDGSSSIEHVSRYLAQLGTASASDPLRVRFFAQSLTGSAFGWYTSLPPDSIRTWKQLEEQFHMQYHSEASESGLADLAQIRQKRGETVAEYIQRFRNLRNRCYSARVTEKEAVELAVVGLASPIKDMASQADYPSLAHMVQKLSAYEQRHPDLYQDKFKRAVVLVEADEDEGSAGDQEEKQLKLPEGLKIPTVQELNGKPYCKWHNSFSHATNDCRVWRQQIQMAIEQGRLIFNQYAMKVDTHPFPAVNMVECTYPEANADDPATMMIETVWLGTPGDIVGMIAMRRSTSAVPRKNQGSKTTKIGTGTALLQTLLGFRNEPIAYNRQLPRM